MTFGQQIRRDRRDHADPQLADKPVPCCPREVSEFIDRAQDVAGALRRDPLRTRVSTTCRALAFDQHAAQDVFQLLDLHRQRRLRDRTGFRRASEVAVTRQGIEIAKLPERDIIHQIILSQQSLKSISPDELCYRVLLIGLVTRLATGLGIPTGGHDGRQNQMPVFGRNPLHPRTGTGGRTSSTFGILHQHSPLSDPMGEAFDYAKEFKSLDLERGDQGPAAP